MKIIVAAITFTLLSVVSFASDRDTQVRDRCGNLVETKDRHGDDNTCGIVTATSFELSDMKAVKRLSGIVTEILSEQKMLINKGDLL